MTEEREGHILVVDDDARIRTLIGRYLARNGFWVTGARDAAHARRLLESLEFDMLVLDVMMPGESGLELTASLRERMTVPILLLTARGGRMTASAASRRGRMITSPNPSSRASFFCGSTRS